MTESGKIKGTDNDENGLRQFVVNCIGENDQRKYFSITPFGVDYNAPVDNKALTTDSRNKDDSFCVGVLNKVKVDDLDFGELALFSTTEDGSEIKSKIVMRNTGKIELRGTGVEISIEGEVNITSSGKVNVSCNQFNVNDGNLTVD